MMKILINFLEFINDISESSYSDEKDVIKGRPGTLLYLHEEQHREQNYAGFFRVLEVLIRFSIWGLIILLLFLLLLLSGFSVQVWAEPIITLSFILLVPGLFLYGYIELDAWWVACRRHYSNKFVGLIAFLFILPLTIVVAIFVSLPKWILRKMNIIA